MGEQDMKRTFGEMALIAEHTEGQMRRFAEQIYAGMAGLDMNKIVKYSPQDETFQYYDEQWKHDTLVPDGAVELVDGMF